METWMSLLLQQRRKLISLGLLSLALMTSILLAAPVEAGAATVEWTWRAEAPLRELSDVEGLSTLLDGRAWRTEIAGQPELPLSSLSLAIPAGDRVSSIQLVDLIVDRIELDEALLPFEGVADEFGELVSMRAEPAASFPVEHFHAHASFRHRGYASAEIVLAPLLYEDGAEGPLLHRLLSARIIVETEADDGARLPLRQRREDMDLARRLSESRVANSASVNAFAPASAERETGGLFQPRSLPSIEGSGVDLVIVCDPAHTEIFETLAEFKLSLGLATVVRDLDWIRANYPQGADLQETIRFFLQDAYEKWGINYVILAGDTDIVPARFVHSYFKDPPEDIPAELYYAQLDGNWNANGDQWFGESNYGGTDGDDVDMVADINLGRLPVDDLADAQLMVDKIIAYSSTPDTGYTRNLSFYAEVLFPATWAIGDPDEWITRNGADYAEYVNDNYVSVPMEVERYYETDWLYPGATPQTREAVLADMENRAHLAHHIGHGFRYTMSVGVGSIVVSDIMALTNGLDHLFSMFALNCTSCAIDYNCLGEAVLRAPEGGGISIAGTMREAFPNTSLYYQNAYFQHLFGDSLSLGEVFTTSHNNWAALGIVEGSHRWTQMSYVFIGDPSINLWLDTPLPLAASLTVPYDLSTDTLTLAVTRDGLPLEGARVIAHKAGEDRAEGVTDALGEVALPFHAESLGDIEISLLNRNDLPTFLTHTVTAGSGPRLSVELLAVEDDPGADASVVGNANGRLDAGETLRLSLRVHNRGGSAIMNLNLDLALPGAELSAVESSVVTGMGLAAGDSLDLTGLFLIDAPLSLADATSVVLEVDLSHDGGSEQDAFDLAAHAPLPRLLSFTINDSAGDGDGEPDVGETYTFLPEWKNYGSTAIEGWTAGLTAIDPDGTVLGAPVVLPLMDLLESGVSAGIDLVESDVATPNRFLLELGGPLGGAWSDTIVVRRPLPPTELLLNSSFASTIIDMAWPIPDGDPASYLVYRSLDSGGPYVLVSSEPTHHAYFRNDGLDESTTYYFVVETVDSSGFRSIWSPENSISTNPSMLDGWPLQTQQGTASSVVTGDIDGDGDKELIAGSDFIYAWHHDGVEVIDGDGNSATYGVLSPSGGSFTAALALANVDTTTVGDEIIGASTSPYGIYVYHGDGSVMSGWPVSMPHYCWGTPAAADMDGDGEVEIFAMCLDGNLYSWDSHGNGGIFATGLGGWSRSSPSLADIDGDPELEVVIGSALNKLEAFNHDGSGVPGFPVSFTHPIFSSVSLADLDGDYDLEMAFLCENDSLYVLEHDGSRRSGFPVHLASNAAGLAPSAAMADFGGDGQMEIVVAGVYSYHSSEIVVLDNQGNAMLGWPIHLDDSSESSPVVADLDGDGELEVLLGTEQGFLHAWELDGSTLPGFPILTEAELRSTPTIDDLDGDYSVDVSVLGWDAFVYVWDLPAFYNNGLPDWRMFRANPARTGVFTPEDQVVDSEEGPVAAPAGALFANYPNPFNPSTQIRFSTPTGSAAVAVKLTVHDITGRRLRTLHDGPLPGGSVQSMQWNGKEESGASSASGVYFARVEMGETVFSQKMLLLK
jgi:hypothetical protein